MFLKINVAYIVEVIIAIVDKAQFTQHKTSYQQYFRRYEKSDAKTSEMTSFHTSGSKSNCFLSEQRNELEVSFDWQA